MIKIPMYDLFNKELNYKNKIQQMLNLTNKMLIYEGLPKDVDQTQFTMMLQKYGYLIVPNPKKYNIGTKFLHGGLGGVYDEQERPTIATVANAYLNFTEQMKIGEECLVLRHDTTRQGLLPLIQPYITLLVESSITMRSQLVNARATDIIVAENDNMKQSAELYIKKLEDGKQIAIAQSGLLEGINVSPLSKKTNDIIDIIELNQYLNSKMLNTLGLKANYNMKRETLNSAETEIDEQSLLPFIDNIFETQKHDIEIINEKYGTNITVTINEIWKPKVEEKPVETVENKEEVQDNEDNQGSSTESED